MKLFANIYTSISTDVLAASLCLDSWECRKLESDHFEFVAKNVQLSLEGKGELLLFGQLNITLEEIDAWVASLSGLDIHFSLDLHGDEARLIRRYHQ